MYGENTDEKAIDFTCCRSEVRKCFNGEGKHFVCDLRVMCCVEGLAGCLLFVEQGRSNIVAPPSGYICLAA